MVTLLMSGSEAAIPEGSGADDALWVPAAEAERATGWALKPEGFCREEVCVPVSAQQRAGLERDDRIDLAALWRHMGRPVLHDDAGEIWALGESAAGRAAQLESLKAPDFELPDLTGKPHRLSDQRGKKVLLVTWASW